MLLKHQLLDFFLIKKLDIKNTKINISFKHWYSDLFKVQLNSNLFKFLTQNNININNNNNNKQTNITLIMAVCLCKYEGKSYAILTKCRLFFLIIILIDDWFLWIPIVNLLTITNFWAFIPRFLFWNNQTRWINEWCSFSNCTTRKNYDPLL